MVAWGAGTITTGAYPHYGQSTVPVGLNGVTAISAGDNHTVALKADGTVVAWGAGRTRTGGDVEFGQSIVPAGLSGVSAIAAGGYHTVAIVAPVPASIFGHPVSQTFGLGGGLTLSVGASGTGLSYQWQFSGTNIPGATQSFLTLSNLNAANAGAYRVVVSSSVSGSLISQSANLLLFDLRLIASTLIAGPVGQQIRVDYADVVNVGITNWTVLTNITLPSSPYLVVDPSSAGLTKRFYRAVPVP